MIRDTTKACFELLGQLGICCALLVLLHAQTRAQSPPRLADTANQDTSAADSLREEESVRRHTIFTAYRLMAGIGSNFALNTGDLWSALIAFSYQQGNELFVARYLPSESGSGGDFSPSWNGFDEWSKDIGVLYGIANKSQTLHLSVAAGIGYVLHQGQGKFLYADSTTSHYEEIRKGTIGIPLQAQMVLGFPTVFGIGLTVYGNINTVFPNYGFIFNEVFGDWSVTEPVPEWATAEGGQGRPMDSSRYRGSRDARNSAYLELFGPAPLYSVNYDRLITDHISASIGATYFPGAVFVPVAVHLFWLPRNGGFEVAAGVVTGFTTQPPARDISLGYATLFLGYRYQPFYGGEFVRIGLSPILFSGALYPVVLSLSGGIAF